MALPMCNTCAMTASPTSLQLKGSCRRYELWLINLFETDAYAGCAHCGVSSGLGMHAGCSMLSGSAAVMQHHDVLL